MLNLSKHTLVVFCVVLSLFKGLTDGALVRRFNYDARLYEHFAYDSRYIQYSRTDPEAWMNITTLTESRNFTFQSMICTSGPGAWVFYPESNYEMGNRQIYYLVVGEHCIRSDDIYSAQPLGKMDEILDQAVLLFSKPHFGSAHSVIEGDGSGEAQSLIFTGPESFSLSGGSAKYCVSPEHSAGICVIPNLKALKIEGSATVSENCTEEMMMDPDSKIIVHNCYTDGVYELYADEDFNADKLKEVCTSGGSAFDKAKFTMVMQMWDKRIGADYLGPHPENGDTVESVKLNIIWSVLDTFDRICPPIDSVYLYLLGSMFEIHLQNMWKKGKGGDVAGKDGAAAGAGAPPKPGAKIDMNMMNMTNADNADELGGWMLTMEYAYLCKANVKLQVNFDESCNLKNTIGRDMDEDPSFGDEWYSIVNGHEFDPVIEQMWLIINSFIPACASQDGYRTNDWNDMILMFNEHFLSPLKDIWGDPQDWLRVYTAVFHGYDIREEHQNILDCLKGVLMSTPEFDPIGRPKGFRDHVTYSYLLPMFGEIEKRAKGDNAAAAAAVAAMPPSVAAAIPPDAMAALPPPAAGAKPGKKP